MREIGLRVAGLFLPVTAVAAPPLAPAILTFSELKALDVKVAAHPEDRESAVLLGKNYAIAILGVTEVTAFGTAAQFTMPGEAAPYSVTALAQSHSAVVLGQAGMALSIYGAPQPNRENNDTQDLALVCIERAIQMEPAESSWRK